MLKRSLCSAVTVLAVCAIGAQPAAAAGPKLGRHQCYQTMRDVSPITGAVTYSTIFVTALTLHRRGLYEMAFRSDFGHYRYHAGKLTFRGGPFNSSANSWHIAGRYYRGGKTMPHSTLHPSKRYSIVLRDLRASDADTAPPISEFDQRQDATFWYCTP